MLLAVILVVGSASVWGQTPITGTYAFGSVTTTSGLTDPTPVPTATGVTFSSFSAVGQTTTNPNASARFSFTGQPTGATNGSDVFMGSLSTSEYYQVSLTVSDSYKLSLSSITFTIQRSGTGIRQYAVRSSADSYAANLPASVTGSVLSVVATNIFQITDATTTATTGSKITLSGSSYTDIPAGSTITFRFYGFNAEAAGGTFSIDDVVLTGSVAPLGGLTPPTLTADATSNDVDNNIDITFTDDATWREAVTAVKVGGTALTATTDYVLTAGNLQLLPSGGNTLLTTAGSKSVTIEATGYNTASVTQQIDAGAATKLGIKTQPAAPTVNGSTLATQPAVYIQDQYGNTTTSTATVVAAKGDAGTWTLGGTVSKAGVSGTATFTNLTATSAAAVTGATISFTSDGLTSITSTEFNISTPPSSLPMYENFNYTVDSELAPSSSANETTGWYGFSSNGTANVKVTNGLTFADYAGSGIGGAASIANTGEDIGKSFVEQTSGTLYTAFVIQTESSNSTGYFLCLGSSPMSTTFNIRVWVNNTGDGVGVTSTSTAPSSYIAITAGTPTLLVLKHDFSTNVSSLYVLNTFSLTEPVAANSTLSNTVSTIGAIGLRQYDASQRIIVDGIRVANTWGEAVGIAWEGRTSAAWNISTNWSDGAVPTSTQNVYILNKTNQPVLSTNAECKSLIIESGANLSVDPFKQLTVSTALINNGALNLLSDASGTATILTPATISGSGTANVNQYLPLPRRTWYMSSPVASVSPAGSFVIRSYDETTDTWGDATLPMVFGKGYSVTPPLTSPPTNILFTGALNTGEQSITLSRQGSTSQAGFNAVGNPYPSFIDWKAMVTKNTAILETGTMWYRSKETDSFKFYTVDASGVVSPSGSTATAFIPPMQAFWVKTSANASTLYFEDNMRSHAGTTENPGPNPLKAPAAKNSEFPLLRLQVSNGINSDEAVIYSYAAATNGYDFYDSPKMMNNDAAIPEIYTTLNNQPIVINVMNSIPLDTEIGLGFVPGNATSFSIRANEISNLPSDVKVILKDNANNGTETDLTDGVTTYEFSPATITGDRFSLIFRSAGSVSGIENPADLKMMVYSNAKNQLTVLYNNAINDASTVSVYNAVGQQLIRQRLTGTSTVLNGTFTSGVYVVKVNNVIRKIIVE